MYLELFNFWLYIELEVLYLPIMKADSYKALFLIVRYGFDFLTEHKLHEFLRYALIGPWHVRPGFLRALLL